MRVRLGMLLALLSMSVPAEAQEPLFDPVYGYRLTHYRGVVPAPPERVARIETSEVRALWRRRTAILIDVNPAEGGVRDGTTGRWILSEPHQSIPGAHWYPESGRGQLADGIGPWFIKGVQRLHRQRPRLPIIIFCRADCWMSWNAALRLSRAGLHNVRWFADGLDGWRENGFAVVDVQAVPLPED